MKVTGEEDKRTSTDFVLWKPKKEGEPFWKSPWCDGRPGWHTECCVMAPKYCKGALDIHAGGEDLIFPHHENEIAQYEPLYGYLVISILLEMYLLSLMVKFLDCLCYLPSTEQCLISLLNLWSQVRQA